MSRIGKKPIPIPSGVEVDIQDRVVKVKGPLGVLSQEITGTIEVAVTDGQIVVTCPGDQRAPREERAKHGLYRALINNMVQGVTKGYEKALEVVGVGYRAELQGKTLKLYVGLNSKRPEEVTAPDGITFELVNPNNILVKGIDKHLVGQTAATIRAIRKPEPYKGKGIRYKGEYVRILPGKSIASGK